LEETNDHDLPWVMHKRCAEGEKAPCHASRRQPESRTDLLHNQIIRDLT
jgi:hypothetical protein